jgi:PAS domain S-box-containing protein
MKRISPLVWISLCLTCLTISALLAADGLVGVSSGSLTSKVEYRQALSEALAVQYSLLAEQHHTDIIQLGLSQLVERNPDILSAAIQLADGTIFVQAGNHQSHWVEHTDNRSTIDAMQVPIFDRDIPWGTLQVAFRSTAESGTLWSLAHPWTRTLLFVAFTGFISYFWFMKRTLRQLDPSKVIPPRVKHALDVLAQGVVMLDHEGSIVLANDVFADKVGIQLEDLIGKPLSRLDWTPAIPSATSWTEPWISTLKSRTTQTNVRLVLPDASGEPRHFVVSSTPILDERAQLRGAVVSFDDITELEKANVALGTLVKELEQSQTQILIKNNELASTNQSLAVEIVERKKVESEREELNGKLRQTARQLGMAEVAATVLHNVGNVLNSVTVSVGLIHKTLQQTPVGHVGRIGQMVQDHANDLGTFLAQDDKGKQIPAYLVALAKQLNDYHAMIEKEINSLSSHIEHIRQVITSQQTQAKSHALTESMELQEVMEQALIINRPALEGASITVTRDYADCPPIISDRHRVLQILVNLIGNAVNAMGAVPGRHHCLTVRCRYAPGNLDRVQIQVRDTGIGITGNDFKRLFTQGFTTREGGHGLGLHGSFLAAQQLQGQLSAASEGEGQGATFTLELPLIQIDIAA